MGKQEMVAWQPADDIKIMELHRTIGPRWSAIASRFPGRTVSSIRNRYLRLHAGIKIRESGQVTKNRCQLCGQAKRGHICEVKLANQSAQAPPASSPLVPRAMLPAPVARSSVAPMVAPPPAVAPPSSSVDFQPQPEISPAEPSCETTCSEAEADPALMHLPMAEAKMETRLPHLLLSTLPKSSPLTRAQFFVPNQPTPGEAAGAAAEGEAEEDEGEDRMMADDVSMLPSMTAPAGARPGAVALPYELRVMDLFANGLSPGLSPAMMGLSPAPAPASPAA